MTEKTETPKAEKPAKVQQNGVTRPKAGTKTARVWDIADEISAAQGSPARRKSVIEKALAEDMNAATAATQYGRWRKFHGLKGHDEPATEAPASDVAVEAEPQG